MRRGLGLVAMGLVLGTGEVPAQTDTLWVRGGVAGAGDTLTAEVVLKNLSPISGAAWTVGFEKGTMTPLEVEPAERTETMEAYSHTADDSLRVLMLDPALGSAVPPGEGAIARMRFLIDSEARIGVYPLRLIQADLGDDAHPPGRIEPVRIDGEVKVTGFVARMEQAMGLPGDTVAVALVLENSEPAAGLQVELAWDGEVLAFVDAASGGRGGDLTAYGRSRQAGQATVLLTDLSGTSLLPAGAGAVLHVRLRIFDRAAVGEVPLRIARALLPDAEGVALPIVARAGKIEVMFRPNRSPELLLPETVFAIEDSSFIWPIPASDSDGDVLTFSLASAPGWVGLDADADRLTGTPADADVGVHEVRIRVSDGEAETEGTVRIEVLNRAPEIVGVPPLRARVGKTCRYVPQVRNLDGGQVRIEAEAEGVRLNAATGALAWTPTRAGEVVFSLIASDPHGAEAMQTFTLSVEARPRVVIDEILADPPSGLEGDANGDGLRDSKADEFVEVLNLGAEAVNIGGWTLSDDDVSEARRFRFPEGTVLESLERAVLFGGGEPLGIPGLVFVDDGSIGNGLTNSEDVVLLIDPAFEDTVAKAAYRVEGDLNQSLVRDSTRWIGHAEPPGIGLFSPGRPRETAASPTKRPPGRRPEGVVINEILANPPSGAAGDANGDGVRHGFEDEFVELWNSGTEPADLSGWRLGDDDVGPDRLFQFPENSLLPVGGYVTLFGGGSPQGVTGGVVVDDGRIGDGLSNAGDRVVLVSADGVDTLQVVDFGKGRPGISWVRGRDGTLVEHDRLPGKGAFSPGYPRPELTGLRLLPDSLRLTPGTEGTFQAFGGFSDSTEVDLTAWVRWTVEDSAVAKVDSTGTVRGVAGGSTGLTAYWGEHIAALARVAVGPAREEADSLAVTDSTGVSARDSTGHGPNRPPEILSLPDTIAVVGLRYRYRPRAEDPEGDPVSLHAPVRPDWLALDGETLEGTPLPGDVGNPEVVVEAGDGQDRSEQRFRIRVLEPEGLLGGAPDSLAFVGLTWRWPFVLKGDFEVQVEGGPVLARSGRVLVWRPRPEDEGERIVAVSVSGNSFEEQVVAYRVFVLPHPHLQVTEVLVDPPQDVDGDGVVDALKDQFVELFNAGRHPMDLSGWSLGDDDGAPFRFPVGSVIRPQGLFTLFGGGTTDIDAGRFSAGGRIGNGLAGSDRILLIAPAGPDTLIDTGYSGGKVGASLVPDPRREGQWVAHTAVSNRRFSPGTVEAVVPTEADTSEAHPAGADTLISADADTSSPFEFPTPNPFNRNTRVGFRTDGGEIRLTVFSILGQPVRRLVREAFPPGRHQVVWDGRDDAGRPAGSGVYLIRIETGQTTHTMRVLLLR